MNGWDDQDGARPGGAIVLARSRDFGDSWESVLVYNARGKTGDAAENIRPMHSLAVDTKTGNDDVVHVTFLIQKPGLTAPNAVPPQPVVATSSDGGRTFAEPVNLADKMFDAPEVRQQAFAAVTTTVPAPGTTTTSTTTPAAGSKAAEPNQAANFGASGARAAMTAGVDAKGKAYILWLSGTANVTPAPPSARMLSTSTDGGKTWTTTQAIPNNYTNASPRMAVSQDGVIHMVYGRNPKPDISSLGEVYHQASTDGGKSWSEAKVLSDDRDADLFGQFFPNISVAPNGRVDAVWWDTRSDPGTRSNDLYYAYSDDNGRSWSKNQRITDQSVDRRLGVWGANYDINSPPAVGSTNAFAIFGWDDTRNTDAAYGDDVRSAPGGGLSDMYTAVAQFEVVGAANNDTAKIVLAAIIGLVLVGLVLLGVAVAAKRRNGPPPAPVTGKQAKARVG